MSVFLKASWRKFCILLLLVFAKIWPIDVVLWHVYLLIFLLTSNKPCFFLILCGSRRLIVSRNWFLCVFESVVYISIIFVFSYFSIYHMFICLLLLSNSCLLMEYRGFWKNWKGGDGVTDKRKTRLSSGAAAWKTDQPDEYVPSVCSNGVNGGGFDLVCLHPPPTPPPFIPLPLKCGPIHTRPCVCRTLTHTGLQCAVTMKTFL